MTASRVLRTALALLLLDAPLISADWFGWLGSRASDGLSYVSRAAVELEKNAATLSVDGRALTADEIEEPLLGAQVYDTTIFGRHACWSLLSPLPPGQKKAVCGAPNCACCERFCGKVA